MQYVAALGMRACDGEDMGKVETDALATGITDQGQNGKDDLFVPSTVQANPLYGSGVFRRRVRLVNQPGIVCAELEDEAHGFRLHVEHDGSKVTAIAVEALRIPMTTCMESGRPLRNLIGCPLTARWAEFQQWAPASANCTYLRDMAWWSLAHAQRNEAVRDYEIAVTDEGTNPSECSVWRNGELVLRWHVSGGTVIAPEEIANRPLLRGFSAWAMPIFQGEAFEAATMLQRGYIVAKGRRVVRQSLAGVRAATLTHMRGTCFTYSPGAVERAVFTADSGRDFTNTPELLLKFV